VDYSELETQMRKVVLGHAAKRVFLCGQSEFLKNSILNAVKLADVNYIITDAPLQGNMETGKAYCMVT
jgi:DeoR/GlpR family transcriptional regulator of sugar metabolism